MADFEKAFKTVMEHEGNNHRQDEENTKVLLCSDCFRDEGLKIDAYKIGIDNADKCPKCDSSSGHKLTKGLVQDLCYRFFVRGTILKLEYGGAPLIQFNPQHFNNSDIDVSPWLVDDVKLIEQAGEIGMFYYGPRFWMLGEVEPLKSLQNDDERNQVIEKILASYPVIELTDKNYFYRLRTDPKTSHDFGEYDTAPDDQLGKNRFDDIGFPVLYGSPDLELCIHECRTTVEDNLFVAKLVPKQKLKVLDLSALLEEDGVTEFESVDIAIHFLFLAGKHSYNICRQIALKAKEKGLDGIIYPSYFSYLRTGAFPFETVYGISIRRIPQLKNYAQMQSVPNLALFGRPVKDNKVSVDCINKVVINRVGYDITFGPAYHKAYEEETSTK
jgi:hypothetical protein